MNSLLHSENSNPGAVSLSALIKDGGHVNCYSASLVLVGGFYMAVIVITSGV